MFGSLPPFEHASTPSSGGADPGVFKFVTPPGGFPVHHTRSPQTERTNDSFAAELARLRFGDAASSSQQPGQTPASPQSRVHALRSAANEAYRSGHYDKALSIYTAALAAVTPETDTQIQATLLCNRAAARLSGAAAMGLGGAAAATSAALQDCAQALRLDPHSERARVRAATCLLRVGRYSAATAALGASTVSSEGDQAAEDVASRTTTAAAALCTALDALVAVGVELWPDARSHLPGTSTHSGSAAATSNSPATDAAAALTAADTALAHAPHCTSATRARVEALLLLRRHKEASAGLDAATAASVASVNVKWPSPEEQQEQQREGGGAMDWWLPWTRARLSLATGDVDAAEIALAALGSTPECARHALDALRGASAARAAGNELFNARRWGDAVEAYSRGLSAWTRQPGGVTISAAGHQLATLLCNRAGALHAQGLRLEATADVGAALVLCPGHAKALSRRAALFMEMRMPKEALDDLKALQGSGDYSATDLAQRVRAAETENRSSPKPEMYAVLGISRPLAGRDPFGRASYRESGAEAEQRTLDVKKAFRRAALRIHPDKAAASLPAGASAGVEDALAADAQRLFRLASASADALGDGDARAAYHSEEFRSGGGGFSPNDCSARGRGAGGFGGGASHFGAGRGFGGSSRAYAQGWRWGTGVYGEGEDEEDEEDDDEVDEAEIARQREAEAAANLRRAQSAYEAARRARETAQRNAARRQQYY